MMKCRMMARIFALLATLAIFEAQASILIKKNTDETPREDVSSQKSAEIFKFPSARKPLVGALPRGANIPEDYRKYLKDVRAKDMLSFYLEALNVKIKAFDEDLRLAASTSGNFCAVHFLSDRLNDLMIQFYDKTVTQEVAIPLSTSQHSHNLESTWRIGLPGALFQREVVEPIVALMDPDEAESVRQLINARFPEQYY